MAELSKGMGGRMSEGNSTTEGSGSELLESSPAPERYLSCRFIERAVTFYPGQVTACCANPATGLTPQITPFNSGELSADALMEALSKIGVGHKLGNMVSARESWPPLVEEESTPRTSGDYAIDEVTIAHFSSCNIRCNYCYTVTTPELTAPLSKAPRMLPTFQQL